MAFNNRSLKIKMVSLKNCTKSMPFPLFPQLFSKTTEDV